MEKRGKCPWLKKCNPECAFYRKGLRYFEVAPGGVAVKPIPFEECAINVGVDCLEQMVGRSIGQQKATEESRNEVSRLLQFFQGMAASKALENKI